MEMQSQGAGTGEATLWAARVGLGLALIGLIMEVASGWGYRHGWWGLRVLPVSAAKAYGLAHATAMGMSGWEVTGRDSAGGGGGGRIEATATTAWFGFKDDVVIRVTPRGADSAVVDMRSKSRVGKSDVGANAARIRDYFAALTQAAR